MTTLHKLALLAVCFCMSLRNVQGGGCPKHFDNCSCATDRIICLNKGYTSFPEDIAMDTAVTEIQMEENDLTMINDNHFKNFRHLTYLNLRMNKISSISENALHSNRMLRTIYLSENKLESIPLNLFKHLSFLEDVYLQHNLLKRIESNHFSGLSSLIRVRLNDNQLVHVGKNAFINSIGLMELYLENNKLETPERNWLMHFDHDDPTKFELYMDGNPWSCDCRMKEFYDWVIKKDWITHAASSRIIIPDCTSPEELRDTQMLLIDSSDKLRCSDVRIISKTSDVNTVEEQEVQLRCSAIGVPEPNVTLTDSKGKLLTSSRGSATYVLRSTSVSDSGEYHCTAYGYGNDSLAMFISVPINVSVYRNPAGVVSTVLMILLVFGIVLGGAVWYYKKRHIKSSYGRLPNDPSDSMESQIASYAKNNADSMRISPAPSNGAMKYSSTEPFIGEEDDEDDQITEYSKDTEFLV